jgi:hypothetical protein
MVTTIWNGDGGPNIGYASGTSGTGSINAIQIFPSDNSGYTQYDMTLYGLIE